jgi:hypothetical protein
MLPRVLLAVLTLVGIVGGGPSPSAAQTPPPAPPQEDPLREFVPKERVPADSAVSFPVDI